MAYRVTAPNGVFCLLPTPMVIGSRQIYQNFCFPCGATLPAEVKPDVIEHFLADRLIEEVPETSTG